jgi:hypothetical protein
MPPDEVAFFDPYTRKIQHFISFFRYFITFAGSNAWRTDRIMSVKELVTSLRDEFDAKIKALESEI